MSVVMTWYLVVELRGRCVIRLARLTYCKVEYALKAAKRMRKRDPSRKLWIEQR